MINLAEKLEPKRENKKENKFPANSPIRREGVSADKHEPVEGGEEPDDDDSDVTLSHLTIISKIKKVVKLNIEDPIPRLDDDLKENDIDFILIGDQQTLLHRLAEITNPRCMPLCLHLARKILKAKPELLGIRDKSNKTALEKSITRVTAPLLEYFLSGYPDQSKLIINDFNSECLHTAISFKLEVCALQMVRLANEQTLRSQNNKEKNTPLHISVDTRLWPDFKGEDERDSRVKLVKTLMKKCPQALMVLNQNSRSPYQHHVFTSKKFKLSMKEGMKKDLIEAATVEFLLKDACMHFPTPRESKAVLYGSEPGV
jgi:hypothetical protein